MQITSSNNKFLVFEQTALALDAGDRLTHDSLIYCELRVIREVCARQQTVKYTLRLTRTVL